MKHFYRSIPGWFSFADLYRRAVKEAPDGARFVEVGCWKGRSAAFMAVEISNSNKRIEFFCVDHWEGSREPKHLADPDVKQGRLYEVFLKNMAQVRDQITIIQGASVSAAAFFKNTSFDFVFIDGAHDYDSVRADIAAWWPKIRPGGALAGDDYLFKGVRQAVDEAFKASSLPFVAQFKIIRGSGTGCQWLAQKA